MKHRLPAWIPSDPARRRWPVMGVVVCLAAAISTTVATTCFVQPVCSDDNGCPPPLVCEERSCVFVCEQDTDCDDDAICDAYRCGPDLECLGCTFPHASSTCHRGDCRFVACDPGYLDLNGDLEDGCEYACTKTGPESCNGIDDDCDGRVDEDFDLLGDLENCGACGFVCPPAPAHAVATCTDGSCHYQCEDGWYDTNGDLEAVLDQAPSDGCDAPTCVPTNNGVEACDMQDNDCDGDVDEGFDKTASASCGPFCTDCATVFSNAQVACAGGQCVMEACLPDYWDLDHNPQNGCETYCRFEGAETCDGRDNDCDGEVDEGLLCCPDDMVSVADAFCMDIYEASRSDATSTWAGAQDDGPAFSVPGVLPWQVGSDNALAEAACQRAGKRLCTPDEWELACRGPDQTRYSYGDVYEPLTCNGIDAHCEAQPAYKGCGLDERNFTLEPTGTFAGCTNEYGVMDINGNVWEHVANGDGTTVRGGAYNCSDSEKLHDCGYIPTTWSPSAMGFRCCLSL